MVGVSASLAGCRPRNPPPPPASPAGTVTLRYGPFAVPAATPTKMGMIENAFARNIPRPCDDCYITGMDAALITADGQPANVAQGLWLHHMVMFDKAREDLTCGRGTFLGGLGLGQRFFSSGNERTGFHPGGRYGYKLGPADEWTLLYDLMNMTAQVEQVYITVTYDYVPASTPGYRGVTPLWLDVNQCINSEKPAKSGQYSYEYKVASPLAGPLLHIGGHVHDGGTHLTIQHNGQLICDVVATYGGSPDYIEGGNSLDMPGMPHISSMSLCKGTADQPVASVRTGDELKLTAYYDSNAHMQMGTEPVMGISIGYFDAD
jgi:hypothetical protein